MTAQTSGLARENIIAQAHQWDTMDPIRKTKNGLLIYFSLITFFTAMMVFIAPGDYGGEFRYYALIDVGVFWFLMIFVFFNHRWAMIALLGFFLLSRFIGVMENPARIIGALISGVLVTIFMIKAIRVATELKKIKRGVSIDPNIFE